VEEGTQVEEGASVDLWQPPLHEVTVSVLVVVKTEVWPLTTVVAGQTVVVTYVTRVEVALGSTEEEGAQELCSGVQPVGLTQTEELESELQPVGLMAEEDEDEEADEE